MPDPSDLNNKNPNIAKPIQQAIIKHENIIVVTHLSNRYLFPKPLALRVRYRYLQLFNLVVVIVPVNCCEL